MRIILRMIRISILFHLFTFSLCLPFPSHLQNLKVMYELILFIFNCQIYQLLFRFNLTCIFLPISVRLCICMCYCKSVFLIAKSFILLNTISQTVRPLIRFKPKVPKKKFSFGYPLPVFQQ
jgi:hypothetical protein